MSNVHPDDIRHYQRLLTVELLTGSRAEMLEELVHIANLIMETPEWCPDPDNNRGRCGGAMISDVGVSTGFLCDPETDQLRATLKEFP